MIRITTIAEEALTVRNCSTCRNSNWWGKRLLCNLPIQEVEAYLSGPAELDAEGFPASKAACPRWEAAWGGE